MVLEFPQIIGSEGWKAKGWRAWRNENV